MQIREFQSGDESTLKEKLGALQDHVADLDEHGRFRKLENFDSDKHFKRLKEYLAKREGKIFLAESEDVVAGFVIGYISRKTEAECIERYPHTDGKIMELYVTPDFRGQGIGSQLLDHFQKYFQSKGCELMKLECFTSNLAAYDFYKNYGFQDREVVLVKKV